MRHDHAVTREGKRRGREMSTTTYQPLGPNALPGQPLPVPRRGIPAWAFWTVLAVAIVVGIIAAVLWYYLQVNRKAILTGTACNYATIQPLTCCPQNSSGGTLAPCTASCNTNSDCTQFSYAPDCVNGKCSAASS
jgi:hypothetical protein